MLRTKLILFGLLWATASHAQDVQEFKLLPSDGQLGDVFGFAVALSGKTVIVGANGKDFDKGATYFFEKSDIGWQEVVKFIPADIAPTAYYGFSVAIDGNVAVVGARNDDDKGAFAGAIYLYERTASGWLQTAKIIPDDVRALDYFGHAVGISGETIIASANGDDVNRGVVYVFGRDESSGEWQWQATVVADDRSQDDVFGASVAIDGDDILVGATSSDVGGFQSGSAYFFRRENGVWQQSQKIAPHDGASEDLFGASVDLSGDYAIIGAIGNDEKKPGAGAAYIYQHDAQSGWQFQAKLTASNGETQDQFGNAVALDGSDVVVGALMQFSSGKGAAYHFRRTNDQWIEQRIFTASDANADDRFGNAVALENGVAVIGARYKDDMGYNSGAAYIFSGFTKTVGIGEQAGDAIRTFALHQNYPNPFNPATAIVYELAAPAKVNIAVFDLTGRLVNVLVDNVLPAGQFRARWDGTDRSGSMLASGIFLLKMQAGEFIQTRKMTLLH